MISFRGILIHRKRSPFPYLGEGLESSGVAAPLAEVFCGTAAGEAIEDVFCSFGGEDIGKRCIKDVAEVYDPFPIEAAGDNGAVGEYTEVVAETVAKYAIRSEGSFTVGPLEAIAVFQVQLVADTRATGTPFPFAGESRL